MSEPRRNLFATWSLATTVATYVLIGVGSLVRAAGAGLGCPDWPRCFGQWIPPTSAAELPPGFDAALFNPAHTWLEYVNRLTGALIGLLILGTVITAWREHRHRRAILWPSIAAFVLVLVEGWLGAKVVESGLRPVVLTAHMVMALVVVGLLLFATLEARRDPTTPSPPMEQRRQARWLWGFAALLLAQIAVGTLVRGSLQEIEKSQPQLPRAEWLPLGYFPDLFHRQLAVIVFIAVLLLAWRLRPLWPQQPRMRLWSVALVAMVGAQILAGLGLAYLGVPPVLQIVHLLLSSLALGAVSILLFDCLRGSSAPATVG